MIVTYGPSTPTFEALADPNAVAVLQRHLPGILAEPDVRLQPYALLEDLAARVRAVGEPVPDLTGMWQELAAVAPANVTVELAPPPTAPAWIDYHGAAEGSAVAALPEGAQRWGMAEVALHGPVEGNPFVEVEISAVFRQGAVEITVGGFYDGNGTYRIRLLPPTTGTWKFATISNVRSLNGIEGTFDVSPPTSGSHGRVVVSDKYHFSYEDGTSYLPLGTTAYAWTHQSEALQQETVQTLKTSGFTKLRMCIFPKSYVYNSREPELFPFERAANGSWDFTRFSVAYFAALEQRLMQLQEIGVEADIILFHPYDRWGFSQMPSWADQLYAKYVVRRLAGFRHVWWSLANEYDFMSGKTVAEWEQIAHVVTAEDHAHHLTSIHNGFVPYDHTRPWVTHCSIQKNDTNAVAANIDQWRRFGKPVVVDEIGYEGNLPWGWGNLTAQELVRRAWEGAVRGGYVNHGETYPDQHEVVWWSHGGTLRGESAERFRFLRRIIAQTPSGRLEPLENDFDLLCGGDADHRLVYFGAAQPVFRSFKLPPGVWDVDLIDTWTMTMTTLAEPLEDAAAVPLPGRQFMAVRFRRR
jgi:hypothetical protein